MNPMIAQIRSLPHLVRQIVPDFTDNIATTLPREYCRSFDHIY